MGAQKVDVVNGSVIRRCTRTGKDHEEKEEDSRKCLLNENCRFEFELTGTHKSIYFPRVSFISKLLLCCTVECITPHELGLNYLHSTIKSVKRK